ncbi:MULTISPECIES: hypothetical protein [unclassified Chitinophaga]|uniref:hypothetical protein n=1 Tax=unclassified Chitinophaga TaxID=2619133 RepID=UPI0030104E15
MNSQLEERVKEFITNNKHDNWFYKGRIKQEESFAQKMTTGRFKPEGLEDFFACTLVVENKKSISAAVSLIEKHCDIVYQRPESSSQTSKFPDAFMFDDLRLYVRLKSPDSNPEKPWNKVIFEVQIKTFLQHAWSIATHDLIYKGDSISWGKARLAYQIKAMLEHAEISIEQVDAISHSSDLATIDPKTQSWKDILNWLLETWPKELLPQNIVGLVQIIYDMIYFLRISIEDIKSAVEKDTSLGLGAKTMNLSPYEIIVKSISKHHSTQFLAFLNDTNPKRKGKIFITPEMDLHEQIKNANQHRIVYSSFGNHAQDS